MPSLPPINLFATDKEPKDLMISTRSALFLSSIKDDLKDHYLEIMSVYPLIGSNLEFLEHLCAELLDGVCEDCGQDFSKNKEEKED